MLKRKLLALVVPLCATLATAASADEVHAATGRNALIASINHAIGLADIDGLTAQYQSKDPVEHALAAMAIERVHGNFEQSSTIANTCESSLKTSEPFIAHYCARFAAANLRLMGDRQKAAVEEESIAKRYKGVLPAEKLNNPDLTQAPLYKDLPPVKVSIPAGVTSIPLKRNPKRTSLVEVTVNGQSLQLTMDTGGYSLLGEDTARKLGVKVLLERTATSTAHSAAPPSRNWASSRSSRSATSPSRTSRSRSSTRNATSSASTRFSAWERSKSRRMLS